jgi:hypothetical protein
MESKYDARPRSYGLSAKAKDIDEDSDDRQRAVGSKDDARLSMKVVENREEISTAAEAKSEPKQSSSSKQSKTSANGCAEESTIVDEKVEAEFEELLRKPNTAGEPYVSSDPVAQKIASGFRM